MCSPSLSSVSVIPILLNFCFTPGSLFLVQFVFWVAVLMNYSLEPWPARSCPLLAGSAVVNWQNSVNLTGALWAQPGGESDYDTFGGITFLLLR